MVIDPAEARIFLDSYQRLLNEVFRLSGLPAADNPLQSMAEAREAMVVQDAGLLDKAVTALAQAGQPLNPEVLAAVRTLRLGQWFYLRDTTRYSIFMAEEGDAAYAVRGLSQPIAHIMGGTGLFATTGIVEYAGSYVCDGIFYGMVAWIGRSMLGGLSEELAVLKKKKAFFVKPGGIKHT